MRKPGILSINIPNQHKTSLVEAGLFDLTLEDGMRVAAIGHPYWPDHDRSLFKNIVMPFLRTWKPHVIFVLGGAIHDDAFQQCAPRSGKKVAVHDHEPAAELKTVFNNKKNRTFEHRVKELGAMCGDFLTSLATTAGVQSHVIYIPSASPLIPNESEIMTFLYYTKKRVDEWRDRHPEEFTGRAPKIPTASDEYSELLALDKSRNVHVMPFGSGVLVNGHSLFLVGDFRRRNPITAGRTEVEQRLHSVVRGFDGKLSGGWFTAAQKHMPRTRKQIQFHEVPHLMDMQRMGYLRDYDRRAPGIFAAHICNGQLHGHSFPIIGGNNESRSVVIDGVGYSEKKPAACRAHRGTLAIRAHAKTKAAAPKAKAPASKAKVKAVKAKAEPAKAVKKSEAKPTKKSAK